MVHQAVTTATPSIHVSLGLQPINGVDLLSKLADLAQKKPEFRYSAPHAYSNSQDKADFYEGFTQQIQELLREADWLTMTEQLQEALKGRLPSMEGRFRDLVKAEELTLTSVVRRRSTVVYQIEQTPEQFMIKFGQQVLIFPTLLTAALKPLFEDRPFVVQDMPGLLSPTKKIELIRQFIKAGFLTIEK